MLNHQPKLSVCIPTCNRANLLVQAIRSVLVQTFDDFELIISDNASKDHTIEVVDSFTDKRIRYIRNNTNIGPVQNFNQCLSLARGRYVTIFHDDDVMLPDNVLLKVRSLDGNPTVGLVHSRFHEIDDHGRIIGYNSKLGQTQTCDSVQRGHEFLRQMLLYGNQVNPPSVMIRKDCYTRMGGFCEKLHFTTDFEYWMRISLYYDVMFLASPLIEYRRHAGWGTYQYMTVSEGSMVPTLSGIREEYAAKRLILKRCEGIIENCKEIKNWVRKRTCTQVLDVMEGKLSDQEKNVESRQAILKIGLEFPEMLKEKSFLKLLVKVLLGEGTVRAVKRISG